MKYRNQWILCICAAFMAALLAGCAGEADVGQTEAHEPQQTQTVPSETETQEPVRGFVHSYPLGTAVSYDLNGDGICEDITVLAEEYGPGLLCIGDAVMEYTAIEPTGYFTVLNPGPSKDVLYVGISDYGFSDDDVTVLYFYDGYQITEAGWFEDILGENSYGRTGAVCKGDGIVIARARMDILGTWTAVAEYKMGEAGLEDCTDLYRYVSQEDRSDGWQTRTGGWEVTTKLEMTMLTDSSAAAECRTVPAGSLVRMIAVRKGPEELSHWVCFEVDALGETLWVLTEEIEWQSYVWVDDGLIDSETVFDGFFYAG